MEVNHFLAMCICKKTSEDQKRIGDRPVIGLGGADAFDGQSSWWIRRTAIQAASTGHMLCELGKQENPQWMAPPETSDEEIARAIAHLMAVGDVFYDAFPSPQTRDYVQHAMANDMSSDVRIIQPQAHKDQSAMQPSDWQIPHERQPGNTYTFDWNVRKYAGWKPSERQRRAQVQHQARHQVTPCDHE